MLGLASKYFEEFRLRIRSEGSFTQNVAITFSGTLLAQGLGFLFTPVIARLYGPEVYGLFALFISITNNLAPVATLQLPSSYVIAQSDTEFHHLVRITFYVLFSFTGLSFLFTYFFKTQVLLFFHAIELAPFVYLIPVYFLFMGMENILMGWNIRRKEFMRGAMGKVISISVSKGLTVIWPLLVSPNAFGMILGNLLLYPLESIAKFNRSIRSEMIVVFKGVFSPGIVQTLHKFKSYPLFVTPGMIINNLSSQLPVYYLSAAFNQTIVGYYALASSIVMMPISIVITSSTTVFLQKAAEVYQRDPGQLRKLVEQLYKRLFAFSVVPMFIFALFSKWVFVFVFGTEWRDAGILASILAMGSVFIVTSGPLSLVFRISGREHVNFIINILSMILRFIGLISGMFYENILYSIIGFSFASIFSNAITLIWVFKISGSNRKMLYRDIILVIVLFFILILMNLWQS